MVSHIKLYGTKDERFREIKEQLHDELGYEPSNPEVVGFLMAKYDADEPVLLQQESSRFRQG